MEGFVENVLSEIVHPAIKDVRSKHFVNPQNYAIENNYNISSRMCRFVKKAILDINRRRDEYIKLSSLEVIEGYIAHTPRFYSIWWNKRHCLIKMELGENVLFIEPYADLIHRLDPEHIALFQIYEGEPPFYFYSDDKNPEFSNWNRFLLKLTRNKIDLVKFFQYHVWADISDSIRAHSEAKFHRGGGR